MSGWILTADRLPEEYEHVLAVMPDWDDDGNSVIVVAYRHPNGWSSPGGGDKYGEWAFSHWMPLPASPTDAK